MVTNLLSTSLEGLPLYLMPVALALDFLWRSPSGQQSQTKDLRLGQVVLINDLKQPGLVQG